MKKKKTKQLIKTGENEIINANFPDHFSKNIDLKKVGNEDEEVEAEQEAYNAAQEICWDAFDIDTPRVKMQMAIEALSFHPGCSDAWYLLGRHASKDPSVQAGLFRNGILAAIDRFGENLLEGNPPAWVDIGTRPYMRCRLGLMLSLWSMGVADAAIAEGWRMIEDNESDNQGVRYLLIGYLAAEGDFDGMNKLMRQYPEDYGVEWILGELIHLLAKSSDEDELELKLKNLCINRPNIVKALSASKVSSKHLPDFYELGSIDEAHIAINHFDGYFKQFPGHRRLLKKVALSILEKK